MLIAFCSIKGSPGVSTTTLATAASWPGGDPLVVEADPAGGDVAARWHVPVTPGLVSVAAAARRPNATDLLADHSQRLPNGVRVVVGPVAADQARMAVGMLATRGHPALCAATEPVLVDVGRLDAASPALPLVRAADALVVLIRPRADELAHLVATLGTVSTFNRVPGLVLLGPGYSTREIQRELLIPVMASLPDDARTARVLNGHPRGPRLDRAPLGRAAARLARTLVGHSHTPSHDTEPEESAQPQEQEATP